MYLSGVIATAGGCGRRIGGFFGNGIEPAFMPRMAFANSFGGEYTALGRAVLSNGFSRIVGTAGIKPAVLPEKRADAELIDT